MTDVLTTQMKNLASPNKDKDVITTKGHTGQHSYAIEEIDAFALHINETLGTDSSIANHLLPIQTGSVDLIHKISDGLLLCDFINHIQAHTIDIRALNKSTNKTNNKSITKFQIIENQNIVISSAKSIGVKVTNIGASELIDGENNIHIVLGIIWQLVKLHILDNINLNNFPELVRLLLPNESLADLLKLNAEDLLLRWFNFHLKNSGRVDKDITNFSSDVKDSKNYLILLNQIAPNQCKLDNVDNSDLNARASSVLSNTELLGIKPFIKSTDITAGNARLNLIFTASIFNHKHGLELLTVEEKSEIEKAGLMSDDVGDSREERAYRMWINSLNLNDIYIHNLFIDCTDGLIYLRLFDHISPGCVVWKNVEMKPNNKFKKVSNCNYVVLLGKQLKFSLVGIQGSDLVDQNKKLILGLVWQMLRYHILKFISAVRTERFGGSGGEVNDEQIIQYANDRVHKSGKSTTIQSFKDQSIKSGLFILDLLSAIEPRIINTEYITPGDTAENQLLNARYAVSVARKLGAVIFCLPEDIVEVKPKMILVLLSSIMAIDKLSTAEASG